MYSEKSFDPIVVGVHTCGSDAPVLDSDEVVAIIRKVLERTVIAWGQEASRSKQRWRVLRTEWRF